MYTRKTCIFCGKPLPKKVYKGTPQALGYCSDACLRDGEMMCRDTKAQKGSRL